MRSSEATSLASTIGSRSMTRQIPVLSMIRFGYSRGCRKRHEGVMRVRVFLGQFTTSRECSSSADWNMRVFVEKHRVETAFFNSSGQFYDGKTIVGREYGNAKSRHSQLKGNFRIETFIFPWE
jgi:hypothetical protein